jgi:hypothetical protein
MHRMNTTTSLSLAEAAAATGMVKSSILRAIKSGRLSGVRDDLGQWRIEASELFRVYRPVAEHQSAADAPQQYAPPDAALIAELSARAVLAEQRLGDIRELLTQARLDIERWRDQADAWREQASTLATATHGPTRARTRVIVAMVPADRVNMPVDDGTLDAVAQCAGRHGQGAAGPGHKGSENSKANRIETQ